MELEDAQRIVANLTTLRVWFEGTKEEPGALSKINKLSKQLETISDQVTKMPKEQMNHIQETLEDTVNSVMLLKKDRVEKDFEHAMKEHTDKLPAQIARIILKIIERKDYSNLSIKSLKVELDEKEKLLKRTKEENEGVKDRVLLYRKYIGCISILVLVLSLTVLGLVTILLGRV